MAIRPRVENQVQIWSQVTFKSSEALSTIWNRGPQASSIKFPQPAVLTLIPLLQHEFATGEDSRDLSQFDPNRFKPPGSIDTVDDLVNAVAFSSHGPASVLALTAHAQPHVALVQAIADEVEKRLKRPQKKSTKRVAKQGGKRPR